MPEPAVRRAASGIPRIVCYDCYSTCYALALRELGRDPRVLGDERCFHYESEPDAAWPLEHFRFTSRPYRELMRAWHGVREHEIEHPSVEAAWEHVIETNAAGRPVIVFVSNSELPHLARQPKDQPHRIVITRSDASGGCVVDETAGLEFTGWLEAGRLHAAMASPALAGLLYPARNTTIELLAGDAPPEPPAERARRMLASFATARADVLRVLAAALDRDAPLEPGGRISARRYAEGAGVFNELRSQRRLNALALEMAAELTGTEGPDDAIARANHLSDAWHAIGLLFRTTAVRRPARALRQIAPRFEQIAVLEDAFSASVARQLGGAACR